MDIKEVLLDWDDSLSIKNIAVDVIRWVGWLIIKGLSFICDEVNKAVEQIYGLLGFANSPQIRNFMDDLFPLVVIALSLSIMFVGYYLIYKRSDGNQLSIFGNLVIIMLVVTCMPLLSMKMADLTDASASYAKGQYKKGNSVAFKIVDDNVKDLLYIDSLTDENSFKPHSYVETGDGRKINNIGSMKKMRSIDINAYMDYNRPIFGSSDLVHEDLWKGKLIENAKGKYEVGEMDDSWIDLLKDYYYRYSVNWFTIIFSLLSVTIVLLFTCFRAGRIIIEIAMTNIIAPFIAVTDIVSGQRLKELFKNFLSLFAVLFLIVCFLGVYFMGVSYLSTMHAKGNINTFVYIIMLLVLALAVIDGASIIEKILGVDAGIKSGYQVLIGAVAATTGAVAVGSGIRHAVMGNRMKQHMTGGKEGKGIKGTVKNAGKKAGNATVGKKGTEDIKNKKDDIKDNMKEKAENATGGRGAYGAVKNAKDGIKNANETRMDNKMGEDNLGGVGSGKNNNTMKSEDIDKMKRKSNLGTKNNHQSKPQASEPKRSTKENRERKSKPKDLNKSKNKE